MSWLPPLLVAVPLLAAAIVAAGEHLLPDVVQNAIAVLAAAATCVLGVMLAFASAQRELVHWFGGWTPRGSVAIGIDFTAGPLAAGMCALVGGIVCIALVYSWTYVDATLFNTLMLVACAGMCGFALSGDLFNIFVWLELTGVAAYALTGLEIRRLGPLQGAMNFAIVNTLGGYFTLFGIALIYARTGALNLAQIGETLARRKPDGLVIVGMTLILCGFLFKAAIVPFHLWLADAYAAAPVPVCLVFAAVMTDIGLFGVARVYWSSFSAAFGASGDAIGDLLLWLGLVTALLGGVMAYLQCHLKRMLAYSVTCHIGVMLAGIGLLSPKGLAGVADMLLAHGLLAGGLFLVTGVLLVVLRSVDELTLHGKGRELRLVAALWFTGAVALAGPPYVGTFLGHSAIDDATSLAGRHWIPPLLWIAGALASGALLRAGARVFLGWGPGSDKLLSAQRDAEPPRGRPHVDVLAGCAAVLVVAGVLVAVVPGFAQRVEYGAERFTDHAGYVARV
ncbi:MAG: multicomponent Na+:H+ antiporter subunit, partial [Gaiellaceae bacterium]|nr:multicomponent Na+:H+ antiporter subunit [Gaiellaceae bacterium]